MPIGGGFQGRAVGPNIGPRTVTGAPVTDLPDLAGSAQANYLVPIDLLSVPLQTGPAVGGVAEARIDAVSVGLAMRIQRISITCDSAAATVCTVYVGEPIPANRIDYSPIGNNDVADLNPPIFVPGGHAFVLRWESATAGAVGIARVQFELCTFLQLPALAVAARGG